MPGEGRQRERPVRERRERHLCVVIGRRLGETSVVEISPGLLVRIAERNEGDLHACHPHISDGVRDRRRLRWGREVPPRARERAGAPRRLQADDVRDERLIRGDGDLEIEVRRPLTLLNGHPAHPVPRGLMRELDRADIVHAHHMRALPSRIAAARSWMRHQRSVVTDHGLGLGRGPHITKRLFDRFLTVSRYSTETLQLPTDKTTTVYGGADTERFHPGIA